MHGEETAVDADASGSVDGLSCGSRSNDEPSIEQDHLPLAADGTDEVGWKLGFRRLVDTRDLVLGVHEKRLSSEWLASCRCRYTYSDDISVMLITQSGDKVL